MKYLALSASLLIQALAMASPIVQENIEPVNGTVQGIPSFQDTDSSFEPKIDDQGRSRVLLCSNSKRQGTCINWGQKDHCCELREIEVLGYLMTNNLILGSFDDPNLKIYNDAVSSIYPLEGNGVEWSFWE
jgi:hypothetical protein